MIKSKLSVLIVDDEPPARKILHNFLKDQSDITIAGEAENGEEALTVLRKETIDLVFLDIQMPGLTGFDLLTKLAPDNLPYIIFVTAYDQYAVKAFEYHAIDYLLKPFTKQRFSDSLNHARELLQRNKQDSSKQDLKQFLNSLQYTKKITDSESSEPGEFIQQVVITTTQPYLKIPIERIDYIEAADHYVHIHSDAKRYLHNLTLKEIESELDPKQFVRIHRRYVINLQKIHTVKNSNYGTLTVILSDKTRLKVSRQKRDILRLLLMK